MHNLVDMKVLHTIRDTPPNPHGILALSYPKTHGDSIIAYPGSSQTGEVQIFDCDNLVSHLVSLIDFIFEVFFVICVAHYFFSEPSQ